MMIFQSILYPLLYQSLNLIKKAVIGSGLLVRIQCFHHCNQGSIPGLGTEIPHQAHCMPQSKKLKLKN